jgi:hypothetical protein
MSAASEMLREGASLERLQSGLAEVCVSPEYADSVKIRMSANGRGCRMNLSCNSN